jgi:hypothetical protein
MSLSQTTELIAAVELSPELQTRLHSSITQYTGLQEQITMLEEMAAAEKVSIMAILEEGETDKVTQDGYHVAIVTGSSSSLDKKKLVALGVTEAMIAAATTTKPKKPYVMLRKVGDVE